MFRHSTISRSGHRPGLFAGLAGRRRLLGRGTLGASRDPRRLPLALLAAALLTATTLGIWALATPRPARLAQYALTGARGPACLRIILANDVSGSMTNYSPAREAALRQLVAWAPSQLRADDELGVLDFAGSARWVQTPRPIGEITAPDATIPPGTEPNAADTNWAPVIDLVAALAPTTCQTSVWFLSDAQYADYPPDTDQARTRLVRAAIHDTPLLVPATNITVADLWLQRFPAATPERFDGNDPNASALTYATQLAHLTGQHLTRT